MLEVTNPAVGDPIFTAIPLAPNSESEIVTAGNFNGDGKLDAAYSSGLDCFVSVQLGNGDGTFQSPLVTQLGSCILWVLWLRFVGILTKTANWAWPY